MAAWRQFLRVAKPFWTGDKRTTAWLLLSLLIGLMLLDTQLAVMLVAATGELTSSLAAHDPDRFWKALRRSLMVLALAVPVYASYYFMRDAFANRWRKWLTGRFLDGYLARRRYYHLGAQPDIDNPDQRIAEDINTFTGRSINFLLILLGSLMQLVAFSAVLWGISKILVAFLAVYAIVGTVVALWVFGQPLIRLNFWQLKREADFRFELMRLRENAESIAFYRGEPPERAQIDRRFDDVYANYDKLIKKQRTLNLYQRAYSQLTLVLPVVILAQSVLSGELEVGRATQAVAAFAAVLTAVTVIVDNFESLSKFVAGIGRLDALAKAVGLPPLEQAGAKRAAATPSKEVERIHLHEEGDGLQIESLTLQTPGSDRVLVQDLRLELEPGDGLLITGPSGSGKSSLLRAIAGLWDQGCGTVRRPPLQSVLFLPQRPYMPVGNLRQQLLYPARDVKDVTDDRLTEILAEVQLPDLLARVGGFDATQHWEKILSMGEQQRLSFARLLVHVPRFVILDEATSALDDANEAALYQLLANNEKLTLISVAHRAAVVKFHTHVLQLGGDGSWTLQDTTAFLASEGRS
ncbi:putative ATP-binding cassette transporter [Variovorax sp. TBS-050B]|uniref:ABC transporter ATP-binding protein/permease n=1 Tax=Variovorax sp. TBS-050B TaxID=2940551 RepID=UPI0024747B8D|nr:ABC transporter ATP-binding protein/permease [Variovorax sp. TBS-050B]MDH6593355.1 putative ATP-binding cassette transporter [Variovorax sp. TBS-050B]